MAKPFALGGKLILVIMAAISGGFLWAMWETGTSPTALFKALSSATGTDETSGAGGTSAGDPANNPAKDPVKQPDKDPSKPPDKDPVKPKDPPKETPKTYLASHMTLLFTEVESALRDGKIRAARDAVDKINKLLVPTEFLSKFSDVETRVRRLWKLVLETTPGSLIDSPEMAHILIKGGGTHGLYVKNVVETGSEYRFETLDGIRSRKAKADIESFEKLDRFKGLAAVNVELERKAGYKGIVLKTEGGRMTFEHKKGTTVEGISYFELADFCARNGANRCLPPLFDKSFELDAGIIDTVHENKAEALVNVMIYFISIRSKEDAKWTRDVLVGRYRETRAFQEKVEKDDELKKTYESLFSEPLAVARTPDKTPDKPDKQPDQPATPDPDPPPPPPPPTENTEPNNERGPVSLPADTSQKVKDLCKKGDEAYKSAMEHLLNSDPNSNRDGWAAENRKALEFFTAAFQSYQAAQESYGEARVPQALLNRFNEVQMCRAMCRKRSVSTKK